MVKKVGVPLFFLAGAMALGFMFFHSRGTTGQAAPATMAATESTATVTATYTPSITRTLTPSATFTSTSTSTFTPTYTPSATLSTRVFPVVIVNPGITSIAANEVLPLGVTPSATFTPSDVPSATTTPTETPLPTVNVPKPPAISDLDLAAGQTDGWVRYEAKNPEIQWAGKWDVFDQTFRSAGKAYKFSQDKNGTMTLNFHGAAVRVRYVGWYNSGVFEIRVDGQVVREVNTFYPKESDPLGFFGTTEVFGLANGDHIIEVVSMGRKDPHSGGTYVAVDAIEVYRTDKGVAFTPTPVGQIVPTATVTPSMTLTTSPQPVQNVVVLQAPPELLPSSAPPQPVTVAVTLMIAYNQSASGIAGSTEGVPNISVRLLDVTTNKVIASGFTDEQGIVKLSATTVDTVRLVVPYFGKVWDLGRTDTNDIRWIIPPGNIPQIIP